MPTNCTLVSSSTPSFIATMYARRKAMFIKHNANPRGSRVGDCVIRAISTALNKEWEDVYVELADKGLELGDMPSSNHVWGSYLLDKGFTREVIPDTCPDCYTVEEFARDHPVGTYVLGTGSHAIAVIDGNWIDSWNSSSEVPIYFYRR